jgi:hypothetical protein
MRWVWLWVVLATASCTELLGLDDLPYGGPGGAGGSGNPGAGAAGTAATTGAGGCEGDLSTDSNNCGACGRTCKLATNSTEVSCKESNCEQACGIDFFQCQGGCIPKSDKCLQPEDTPRAVALDGTHVYVALSSVNPTIVRYDRDLSNRTVIADEDLQMNFEMLLVHGGTAYWGTVEALRRMPLPGGEVDTMHSGNVFVLEAGGSFLYWSDFSDRQLWRMPLAGGQKEQVTQLEITDGIASVALSNTDIFYSTTGGSVEKIPVRGGSVGTIASGLSPDARPLVALATGPVFWGQSTGIVRYENRVVQPVVNDTGLGPLSLAVTSSHLYYSSWNNSQVMRVTHDGGSPVSLGDRERNVANVTVGHGAVYWTRTNTIVRAHDP